MDKVKILKAAILSKVKKLCYSITRVIKLPNFHPFPKLRTEPISRALSFLFVHKILIITSILFVSIVAVGIYTGYFLNTSTVQTATGNKTNNSISSNIPKPTLSSPSPSDNPSPTDNNVLGASIDSSSNNAGNSDILPSPTPYPVPTYIPIPTTTLNSTSPTSSNSSGNSHCTTGAGVPNSWFSDVYPASPISSNTGNVTLTVDIRDCNKNTASVNDTLSISLSSGDSSTQINGNNLPYSTTTQNGQASFTVTSQNAGTDIFIIQDTTSSFTVTDTNNNNPSVIFSSSQTPTPNSTQTPTLTPTLTPIQSPTPTPSQTPTLTPTLTPNSSPTPTP